jgi:hypothetical protein
LKRLIIQVILLSLLTASAYAAPVKLGTAGKFAVLAGSTITNTGPSVINGDVGLTPGTSVTGFPPGSIVAPHTTYIADGVALQAQSDLTTAYDTAAGASSTSNLTGQDLGGLTLTPGVYSFSSSAQLTGDLTLQGSGDPNAQWIFQIGSTLTTASNSSVKFLSGTGTACDVFWQVGSSATLGTYTSFIGSILALDSITMTTGSSLHGRALARNYAVTMDTVNIDASPCRTPPAAVPEASTLIGFGSALALTGPGLLGWLRRRRA